MRGLAEEVRGFWDACKRVAGGPVPGGQLEIVDLYEVLNWLRRALVSVRSLDLEVFAASFPDQYRQLRDGDTRGVAVRGLIAPRNQAVHHPEIVDPDLARAVGPIGEGFVICPRWRMREDLPTEMFEQRVDIPPNRGGMHYEE